MRRLGLIVGCGPETTIPYYRGIVYGVQKRTGHLPRLSMESLSTFEVLGRCRRGDWDGLTAYFLDGIESLAAAGADCAALACNTGHLVMDELRKRSPVPLVSIVDATVNAVKASGCRRVVLLGTPFTMKSDLYRVPLEKAEIGCVVPTEAEMTLLDGIIEGELGLGNVRAESVVAALAVVARLVREEGADGLILGCTELPLLFAGTDPGIVMIDTVEAHVAALVDVVCSAD